MNLREDEYNKLIEYENIDSNPISHQFNTIRILFNGLFFIILALGVYLGFSCSEEQMDHAPQIQVMGMNESYTSHSEVDTYPIERITIKENL